MLPLQENFYDLENEEDFEKEDSINVVLFEREQLVRIQRAASADKAIRKLIEQASNSAELLQVAELFVPPVIVERLEEIYEPFDDEDESCLREPALLLGSLRAFLQFCLRAQGGLDVRFSPGRTYKGELGIQLLNKRLGDLSIRFGDDGYVLVALVSDLGVSSGRYIAEILLTPNDHFCVHRWI